MDAYQTMMIEVEEQLKADECFYGRSNRRSGRSRFARPIGSFILEKLILSLYRPDGRTDVGRLSPV